MFFFLWGPGVCSSVGTLRFQEYSFQLATCQAALCCLAYLWIFCLFRTMGVDGWFAFAPSLRVSDCCAHGPVYLRWMQYFSFLQFNPQIFPYSKCKERHTLPFGNLRSTISRCISHRSRGISIAMSDKVCHQDLGSGGIQACPSQRTCA